MDFDSNSDFSRAPQGPPPVELRSEPAAPPRKKRGWRIFWAIFTVLSVLANIFLFLMLIAMGVAFAFGAVPGHILNEEVLQEGPRSAKIAVIYLDGIIDGTKADEIHSQIKAAHDDDRVKGLIVRIDSPGGTISGSDEIYNELRRYRRQTGKPAVALMQGVAASGAYYASVACESIIAEPTAITGSIGVIMGHFVLQQLLEEKLGIQPVILKAGAKKDWPSSFETVTEEQKAYLQERLIGPAYNRFVQVVAENRAGSLTLEDVERLADGSIYPAEQALDEKLIDKIGYLDDAIQQVKELAGIEEAQVIEYRRPFSLAGLLGARSGSLLKISKTTLYELSTPEVLYLWNAHW